MCSIANLIYLLLSFIIVYANSNTSTVHRHVHDDFPYVIFAQESQESSDCRVLLGTFAAASADFTECVIINAKPISLCRNCVIQYENTIKAYNDIQELCDDVLFNVDRLQVVESMNDNNENMWSDAKCLNCFNASERYLSAEALEFFFTVNETQECFKKFNISECVLDDENICGPNKACTKCNKKYETLKKLYREFLEKYSFPNVCMDVVDTMNITRATWNALKCIQIVNNVFVLFTLVGFLCLLPIVFYLSSWISSDERKSTIVPQKRLVATRSHAQLSSINF